MNNNVKVSIITPSYNQGQFIEETILSVLNQTYQNIQYIVVDGGSSDQTMEIVNKYADKIDIIIHEKDKGQSDAINKGFKLANGELVGWINSDDLLYPNCVEKIVELYQRFNDGSIYYCSSLDWIDSSSNHIKTVKVGIPSRNHLLNNKYSLIQQGSFYTKELLNKVNYIDDTCQYCMDLDLWLRLSEFGKIYSLDDKTYSAFRIWEETKTSNGGRYFLNNIREVLLKNGASRISLNLATIYWYSLKLSLNKLLSNR